MSTESHGVAGGGAARRRFVADRSLFIRHGKRALWVLAATTTLALVVVAWLNAREEGGRIVFSGKGAGGAPEPSTMTRPRYQGFDVHGRPFTIIADTAVQKDRNTVVLSRLQADLTLQDSSWLALTALQGVFHTAVKRLELEENIHLFYDGGYEFRTEAAWVQVDKGEAGGDSPVEGQGPTGTLKADRFTIMERGAILRFLGNVHVTLFLK